MSILSVNTLSVGYGKHNILDDVSFQLEDGCLMGIIGANGSGKTTLIKSICGILPHKGVCTLDNVKLEDLSPREIAKRISYIPQRSGIYIDISAMDVVLMGFNPHLRLLEGPWDSMKEAASKAISDVGLSGLEDTNYMHLSEGQKQLCILARTLVSDTALLLLDEPESSLDFRYRYQMLSLLKDFVASANRSALIALHDPSLALNFCDRLLLLSDGHVIGTVEPKKDPISKIEDLLSAVYGRISLQICHKRNGESAIVMLKEDEQ